jgi:NAD(P)-dependent dehydrogenase (short-subunit alcohol dehydrogenase family)
VAPVRDRRAGLIRLIVVSREAVIKTIIITGGASGIGRAVASALATAGDHALLLADRNQAGLDEAATELGSICPVTTIAGDLSTTDFADNVVARCVETYGRVDGLVSNAGVLKGAPLTELSVEDFDFLFAINTRPAWLLGKAAHPYLKASRGAIVATASIAAFNPTPPLGSYAASKAALLMLVRQMALEWGPDGIRCNSVSPGPTLTPMNPGYDDAELRSARERTMPLRKLGTSEDVAKAILFLLGPESGHVTGQDIAVDGGLSLALMTLSGSGQGQPQKG